MNTPISVYTCTSLFSCFTSPLLLHCVSIPSQISELRASVSRAEQQAAWREEHMKQEVADMQRRLQEAEMRNQELTASISQSMFVY